MNSLIFRLGNLLQQIKGFNTAYGTNSNGKMLVDYNGERFLLEVKKIGKVDEDFKEDYDKYVKNQIN